MSKAPEPGQVKTRLVPDIGAPAATALYRELLWDTLQTAVGSNLCPVELWCSPDIAHPFFEECRQQFGVELHEQTEGDLGWRMSHALETAGRYAQPVVLIGADCPTLSADDLEEAIVLLATEEGVVLGPAEDGGYYLIGMRGSYPFVFDDIPWGTPGVLKSTQARLDSRRVRYRCLAVRPDLDDMDDYRNYLAAKG